MSGFDKSTDQSPSRASPTSPTQPETTSPAVDHHANENITMIENDGTGDNWQIMVSTNEKTIHGTNKGRGWRNRQLGGNLADESVQQISADMVSISLLNARNDNQNLPCKLPTGDAKEGETGSRFGNRHGPGHTLLHIPQTLAGRNS